jgi:adenylate cyclase
VGKTADAIRHAEHGLRLSPFDQSLFSYYNLLGLAHYAHGDMEQSVKWYHLSFTEMPNFTATLRVYAAALAAAGRAEQARDIAARLMAVEPAFTISNYARTRLPFRDERIRARYITDLHAAGLPG